MYTVSGHVQKLTICVPDLYFVNIHDWVVSRILYMKCNSLGEDERDAQKGNCRKKKTTSESCMEFLGASLLKK